MKLAQCLRGSGDQIVFILPDGGVPDSVDAEVLAGLAERTDAILAIVLQVSDIRPDGVRGASAEAVQWEMIVKRDLREQQSCESRCVSRIDRRKDREGRGCSHPCSMRGKGADDEIREDGKTHHSLRIVEALDVLAWLCVVLRAIDVLQHV